MISAWCLPEWSCDTNLVEVEYQIQLANIAKETIQDFDKEVDSLEVC